MAWQYRHGESINLKLNVVQQCGIKRPMTSDNKKIGINLLLTRIMLVSFALNNVGIMEYNFRTYLLISKKVLFLKSDVLLVSSFTIILNILKYIVWLFGDFMTIAFWSM